MNIGRKIRPVCETCLNCASDSFRKKYYIKEFERNIVICTKCGLVQVDSRDKTLNFADYENATDREDKLRNLLVQMEKNTGEKLQEIMQKETLIKENYFKRKVKDIKKYRNQGKLLDVGCAQGAFLFACLGSGFQLYGVEPSKYTCAEAMKRIPSGTIYNCTLLEAKFPSETFDVVTLINTLEHLLNPRETIAEVYRILKPCGVLMIETPNVTHWIPFLMGKYWIQFRVPDHVSFFSKRTLTGMLEEIGFEVQKIVCSYKTMSIRLFLFQLSRCSLLLSKSLKRISERMGLDDKVISIPQWDELVLYAIKKTSKL